MGGTSAVAGAGGVGGLGLGGAGGFPVGGAGFGGAGGFHVGGSSVGGAGGSHVGGAGIGGIGGSGGMGGNAVGGAGGVAGAGGTSPLGADFGISVRTECDDSAVTSNCCTPHPATGCDTQVTEDCVCLEQPECCAQSWSAECAVIAGAVCGACPTIGCADEYGAESSEELVVGVQAFQTYYVHVDGYEPSEFGSFTLLIEEAL